MVASSANEEVVTMTQPEEQQDQERQHQSEDDLHSLLRLLKALADQSRLRLIGILANGERSVEELATLLDLRAATVSHHLNLLKELDLVSMRAEGNTHIYQLNARGLSRMTRLFISPERLAVVEHDEGDVWERKVLRDFFADGRLKGIPTYRKKRLVILKWLAGQFAWDRTYSEAEVNELIKRYHPDAATLRRDLIGFGFMQREHGTYWRIAPPGAQAHDDAAAVP
jgi:DNA-binding transcriptional ArsR family regulator